MLQLIVIILIICFIDLRAMIKNKQKNDIVCFLIIALGSILYGYYYTNNVYTASLSGFFLRLLQIQ